MRTLKDIIEYKKDEVHREKKLYSKSQLHELISTIDDPRKFSKNLSSNNQNIGLIAEIKKASPSKGVIRINFDPIEIAIEYKNNGATCLSILTDKYFFQGDNKYIQFVKDVVDLPILRKDFIVDSWQISQSRALNADCILLILSCLTYKQASEFEEEAMSLGMDVLLETHTPEEIEMANMLKSALVGINNRNLKTMKVDTMNSVNLIKYLDKNKIPISESGISKKEDITLLKSKGFNNFLIGEAFMRDKDISKKIKEILN